MKKSVAEASRKLSKPIEAVGQPTAEIVPIQRDTRAPLGFLRGKVREIDPSWWRPMTDEEVDAFVEGRY